MTVKLSWSILNAWASGHFEDAVAMYLGKPIPESPAMQLGKLKHELWQRYIDENKALPLELGGGTLRDPITERKYQKQIPLGPYTVLLRGVIDLSDDDIIYDFKCGLSTAGSYLDKLQMDYYKLLYPKANTGIYICFNPYADTYSKGIKYLTDANAEAALNHIITFGGELIAYLASQKLLIDYKEPVNEKII